jgi:hypothetical protein
MRRGKKFWTALEYQELLSWLCCGQCSVEHIFSFKWLLILIWWSFSCFFIPILLFLVIGFCYFAHFMYLCAFIAFSIVWHMNVSSCVQPHGFFNCSPAVDVPPNSCEVESKDTDIKDNGASKPIQSGLASKL